jgi:hypothetical protein
MFGISEFGPVGLFIADRQVVVAVDTGEVATPGDLNGAIDGDPFRYNAIVNAKAPVLITLGFHASTWYHTTRLRAKIARKTTPITKTRKKESTKEERGCVLS